MQTTDKNDFLLPEGEDYYNENDRNENWRKLDGLLSKFGVNGSSIEKLPDGSIKITFVDNTYTIYQPMEPDGSTTIKDYDKDGNIIDERVENAMVTLVGVNLRIDNLIKNLDDKYEEIMNLLWAAAVKWELSSSIIPIDQSWENRDKNQVRVNRSDGTYSIFTRQPNGTTIEHRYNSNGALLSTNNAVRFERDFIRTNVRIVQLENDLKSLKNEIKNEWMTLYAYQFSLVSGTPLIQGGRSIAQILANGSISRVLGTKTVAIEGGTYSCTVRIRSTMKINANLVQAIILDKSGRTLANASFHGSNFTNAAIYYSFSFAFCTIDNYSTEITITLQTYPTGGPTPTLLFDTVRLKQISTGIGSSPNSVTI